MLLLVRLLRLLGLLALLGGGERLVLLLILVAVGLVLGGLRSLVLLVLLLLDPTTGFGRVDQLLELLSKALEPLLQALLLSSKLSLATLGVGSVGLPSV